MGGTQINEASRETRSEKELRNTGLFYWKIAGNVTGFFKRLVLLLLDVQMFT